MSNSQIIFFRKSLCDLDNTNITTTITDTTASNNGQDYVSYMYNRKNDSAWITTGSNDAANTEIEVDFSDSIDFTDILIVGHNLKSYVISYWTGVSWTTLVTETTNIDSTNHHNFSSVSSSKIKIVITGTQTADDDKYIKQLIVTRKIGNGQLEGWPVIKKPVLSTSKKRSKMLSGKIHVTESIKSFSTTLSVKNWNNDSDMSIVEDIYFRHQGVLLWLCGGDESQFATNRMSYRREDIFLVRPVNEYTPELHKGIYTTGAKIDLKLEESIS